MKTKERLAKLLTDEGLTDLALRAADGLYDDFWSESATPILDLVTDLLRAGRADLATRAKQGEWDGTHEEAEEWYRRSGGLA